MSEEKTDKESEKKQSTEKPKKVQEKSNQPVLLELGQVIWRIIILTSGIATTVISYSSGCSIVASVVRGSVAILMLGILGWLMNWLLIQNSLEIVQSQIQKAIEESQQHTINKSA
mgnify:CR=1 FL=1